MLVNTVSIVNVDGSHTFELNDVTSPLRDLDVTLPDRANNTRYRQQQMGAWPTRSYEGGMNVHVEGALFANDSTSYIAARKALMLALRGVPGANVVNRRRGRVFLQFSGEPHRWYFDYGPLEVSSPVQGDYPALTEYLITFGCYEAWFIDETTPTNLYYWS